MKEWLPNAPRSLMQQVSTESSLPILVISVIVYPDFAVIIRDLWHRKGDWAVDESFWASSMVKIFPFRPWLLRALIWLPFVIKFNFSNPWLSPLSQLRILLSSSTKFPRSFSGWLKVYHHQFFLRCLMALLPIVLRWMAQARRITDLIDSRIARAKFVLPLLPSHPSLDQKKPLFRLIGNSTLQSVPYPTGAVRVIKENFWLHSSIMNACFLVPWNWKF